MTFVNVKRDGYKTKIKMKYKIYQENDLYAIYDVYDRLIAKCRDINQVKLTLKYLTNPQPANSSSILNEPIAKMTREIILKIK